MKTEVGLCEQCVHTKRVQTTTSVFWRCLLADDDARFRKYPELPVLKCTGHQRTDPEIP